MLKTKFLDENLKKLTLLFMFYLFAALSLLGPISVENFIPGLADYINHLATIIETKAAFNERQFPLRVLPLESDGFRYPLFQFYSPTTYTFAGLIYYWITPHNPMLAFKVTLILGITFGGLAMYYFILWFIRSKPIALLGSMVYLSSPYFVIVINGFGSLSETLGLSILPIALYFTIKHYYHPRLQTFLIVSLLWYLLITTHLVTFVYSSIFLSSMLLILSLKNKNHRKNFIRMLLPLIFGVILSFWFLIPVAYLGKYLAIGETFANSEQLKIFSPVISQLLSPGGTLIRKSLEFNPPALGLIIFIGFAICLYVFLNKESLPNKRANYWLPILLSMFTLGFILIWSPFDIWQWLPQPLRIAQYSWRLLSQLIWIGALLFSAALCWMFQNKLDRKHVIIGILLILITNHGWFPIIESSNIEVKEFIQKPKLVFNQNAYLINFNRHLQFVSEVDTMGMELLIKNNVLQLNEPYYIKPSLITTAYGPYISMQGSIPHNISKNQQLGLFVNNQLVQTYAMHAGKFHWKIFLKPIIKPFNHTEMINLKFKLIGKDSLSIKININQLVLSGFLNPDDAYNVDRMKPNCKQHHAKTICHLTVPENVKLLELPILYYPNLLDITLNGKPISYQGIMHKQYLLTSIKPQPGENKIQIFFRGIAFANYISLGFWILWICLLLGLSGQYFLKKLRR